MFDFQALCLQDLWRFRCLPIMLFERLKTSAAHVLSACVFPGRINHGIWSLGRICRSWLWFGVEIFSFCTLFGYVVIYAWVNVRGRAMAHLVVACKMSGRDDDQRSRCTGALVVGPFILAMVSRR
ncbi:hypothetical protein U1Q18_039315, partial [Sarracenia purpurea var. burkii]